MRMLTGWMQTYSGIQVPALCLACGCVMDQTLTLPVPMPRSLWGWAWQWSLGWGGEAGDWELFLETQEGGGTAGLQVLAQAPLSHLTSLTIAQVKVYLCIRILIWQHQSIKPLMKALYEHDALCSCRASCPWSWLWSPGQMTYAMMGHITAGEEVMGLTPVLRQEGWHCLSYSSF